MVLVGFRGKGWGPRWLMLVMIEERARALLVVLCLDQTVVPGFEKRPLKDD